MNPINSGSFIYRIETTETANIDKKEIAAPETSETLAHTEELSPLQKLVSQQFNTERFKILAILEGTEAVQEAYAKKEASEADLLEKELLSLMRPRMTEAEVQNINEQINFPSLTSSSLHSAKTKTVLYRAAIIKKKELEAKVEELRGKSGIRNRISRLRAERELRKAPDLEKIKREIKNELSAPFRLLNKEEAKRANSIAPELKFGESHLKKALQDPLLWTPIHSVTLKVSEKGSPVLSLTKLEPIDVKEGGRPSLVKRDPKLTEKPLNFWKTTHTVKNREGNKLHESTSFRGAFFITPSAAQAALKEMGNERPIHINSLLTPSALRFVRDRRILNMHSSNIRSVGNKNVALSNFGVNEGAVGAMKGVLKSVKLGWHTSIGRFSNPARIQLNERVNALLQEGESQNPEALDKIAMLLPIALEMEKIWAENSYASADKMEGQFRMPALWKAVDALTETITYTNCWSGKDRTSAVEAESETILDESLLTLEDKKRALEIKYFSLSKEVPSEFWKTHRSLLTSGLMKEKDLAEVASDLSKNCPIEQIEEKLQLIVLGRLYMIKRAFGESLLEQKTIKGSSYSPGTIGISTNTPKEETAAAKLLAEFLPKKNLQRVSAERRATFLKTGTKLTAINTGFSGVKLDTTAVLKRALSGFDREFILHQVGRATEEQLISWMGLSELGEEVGKRYATLLLIQKENPEKLRMLLSEIEERKFSLLRPQAKVDN